MEYGLLPSYHGYWVFHTVLSGGISRDNRGILPDEILAGIFAKIYKRPVYKVPKYLVTAWFSGDKINFKILCYKGLLILFSSAV
jgi:hypothetical protein